MDELPKCGAEVDKGIILCYWHYSPMPSYRSVDLFRDAGYRQMPCFWFSVTAAKMFTDYAREHGKGSVIGLMLTTWHSCASSMDAIEAKVDKGGKRTTGTECWKRGEVYRAFR